jgi:hypothetical protein
MAIMYKAWFSLRSPARDSRWRMTWPLEASRGAVPVWAAKLMLAGEPADVADLTQKRGCQHRSHPEQLNQAGVGVGDRCLDPGLDGGDPLLQLTDVGHELGGQLPAGDRRLADGRDPGQQGSGALGGQVAPGTTRDQVHQQPMQPVDGLSAGGDQVLAALGQQVQHRCLVLNADLPQGGDTASGDGDRDRVVGVALAAVAD